MTFLWFSNNVIADVGKLIFLLYMIFFRLNVTTDPGAITYAGTYPYDH